MPTSATRVGQSLLKIQWLFNVLILARSFLISLLLPGESTVQGNGSTQAYCFFQVRIIPCATDCCFVCLPMYLYLHATKFKNKSKLSSYLVDRNTASPQSTHYNGHNRFRRVLPLHTFSPLMSASKNKASLPTVERTDNPFFVVSLRPRYVCMCVCVFGQCVVDSIFISSLKCK